MEALFLKSSRLFFATGYRRYFYLAAAVIMMIRYVVLLVWFPVFTPWERLFFVIAGFFLAIFAGETVDAINRFLNRRMPYEAGVVRRLVVQTCWCLLLSFSMHTFFLVMFANRIPIEITPLARVISYFVDFFIVLSVNALYFGTYFFNQWRKNLLEKEKWHTEKALLQKERIQAQYENLKNQLNPHFLFNSLTSLNSLISEDQQLASQFLQQLSRVFRYVLENRDKELVTLETELAFISRYIFLLKTRFGEALCIETTVPASQLQHQVVPVTLQILLENVIKHNRIDPQQCLYIWIETEDTYLVIRNHKKPKIRVEESNGLGLANMQALYTYLSDRPVEIRDTPEQFTVRVPLL